MTALIVFHCGRNEYLTKTLLSLTQNVMEIPERSIIVNDSSDLEGIDIARRFGIKKAISTGGGYGIFGAVELAWRYVRENWPDVEFIWHQENDFVYPSRVDLQSMYRVLEDKNVLQVALKRQAWYKVELIKGDFMLRLNSMKKNALVNDKINGVEVVKHKEFFTNNPSLYRIENMPERYQSEYGIRSHFKKINPNWICTFLGKIEDSPRVTHIGEQKK